MSGTASDNLNDKPQLAIGRLFKGLKTESGFAFLLLMLILVSLRLTFSTLQFDHDADSILPVLISTIKWSWFYWGQNRLGTLVPLLAMPIKSEFWNLMFQSWMTNFAGIYALLIIPAWILNRKRAWIGGLCSCILFSAFFSRYAIFQYFSIGLPYAVSMALMFSSLLLIDSSHKLSRYICAFFLMCVGIWVNIGIYPLVFALVFARSVLTGWTKPKFATLAFLSVAFGINLLGSSLYPIRTNGTFGVDIEDIDDNILPILRSIGEQIDTNAIALIVFLCLLIAALVIAFFMRRSLKGEQLNKCNWRLILSAFGGTFAFLLFLATSDWVRINLYSVRYAMPVIIMFCAVLGSVCEIVATTYLRNSKSRAIAIASLLVICYMVLQLRFPYASTGDIKSRFDLAFGRHTGAIMDEYVQVVYGDFRDVWPAVFHAKMRMRDKGIERPLLGITDRSENTRSLWWELLQKEVISARIASSRWPCIPRDNINRQREQDFALPMVFVDYHRSDTLMVGKFRLPGNSAENPL